jgi:hypothetical protein
MSSRPALAFAALLVGGLLGFLLGDLLGDGAPREAKPISEDPREPPAPTPAPAAPAAAAAPVEPAPLPAPPPSPPGECNRDELDWLRSRVTQLESQVGLQNAMLEGYRFERDGKPTSFPDDPPPQYREEFESTIQKAISELEGDGLELTGVDCKEWPCIALIRKGDGSGRQGSLTGTDTWRQSFGGSVRSGYSGHVKCGDGRKERIELISPTWDGKADLHNLSEDHWNKEMDRRFQEKDFEQTEWQKNVSKRLHARWKALRESWQCRPAE